MEVLSSHSIFKQMVVTAARLEGFANRYLFAPIGLSSTTLKILHALSKHDALTPTRLMEELSCTKSNITQRLNYLEHQGFIRRQGGLKDHRQVRITLTPLGHKKILEAIQVLREKGSLLEKHFQEKEKGSCLSFMKKVNLILDRYEPKL